MIIGIGMDLLEIERVRKLLAQPSGKRFAERVLTPFERSVAQSRKGRLDEFVASRFAAKEAVVKALGCGIGKQIGFQDIEIRPDRSGRPMCVISDLCAQRLGLDHTSLRIHLSITHSETMAGAYAVAERVSD